MGQGYYYFIINFIRTMNKFKELWEEISSWKCSRGTLYLPTYKVSSKLRMPKLNYQLVIYLSTKDKWQTIDLSVWFHEYQILHELKNLNSSSLKWLFSKNITQKNYLIKWGKHSERLYWWNKLTLVDLQDIVNDIWNVLTSGIIEQETIDPSEITEVISSLKKTKTRKITKKDTTTFSKVSSKSKAKKIGRTKPKKEKWYVQNLIEIDERNEKYFKKNPLDPELQKIADQVSETWILPIGEILKKSKKKKEAKLETPKKRWRPKKAIKTDKIEKIEIVSKTKSKKGQQTFFHLYDYIDREANLVKISKKAIEILKKRDVLKTLKVNLPDLDERLNCVFWMVVNPETGYPISTRIWNQIWKVWVTSRLLWRVTKDLEDSVIIYLLYLAHHKRWFKRAPEWFKRRRNSVPQNCLYRKLVFCALYKLFMEKSRQKITYQNLLKKYKEKSSIDSRSSTILWRTLQNEKDLEALTLHTLYISWVWRRKEDGTIYAIHANKKIDQYLLEEGIVPSLTSLKRLKKGGWGERLSSKQREFLKPFFE